jgi:isoprenylcysteine carboxyl methyltransferase (ICMT) family protein YpbQ
MTFGIVVLLGYAVASRLLYVCWVGQALRRREARELEQVESGANDAFAAFRRRATWLMRNDAVALVAVCVVTRNMVGAWNALGGAWNAPLRIGIALLLIAVGLGTKLWAARTLGDDAYYWHNFFVVRPHTPPDPPGPYRYLSNPMYTVGYLHAYGFALLLGSLPGLALALFDQAAILIFHRLVEKPHYRRLLTAMESSTVSQSAAG